MLLLSLHIQHNISTAAFPKLISSQNFLGGPYFGENISMILINKQKGILKDAMEFPYCNKSSSSVISGIDIDSTAKIWYEQKKVAIKNIHNYQRKISFKWLLKYILLKYIQTKWHKNSQNRGMKAECRHEDVVVKKREDLERVFKDREDSNRDVGHF